MKRRTHIQLTPYEDLFSTEEQRQDLRREKMMDIPLDELHPFKDHPFKVLDDDRMADTTRSVQERGVLVMVDSNIQRENMLPSERAFAYKMKLEVIDRVKGRPADNAGQVVPHFGKRSTEIVAEGTGESYKQIQRYIRLTYLIPKLLNMVDERKIAFNPAVELSYLKQEEQAQLLDAMDSEQATPSLSQAQRLKRFSQEDKLSPAVMSAILSEEKKVEQAQVSFSTEALRKYFPKSYTPQQMETVIFRLLDTWQRKRQQQQER